MFFNRNARYRIVHEDDKAVFIVDDNGDLTITNDAENVCHKLLTGRKNKRIFYKDSCNNWDELVHNGFHFSYFGVIRADDELYEILEKVKKGIY